MFNTMKANYNFKCQATKKESSQDTIKLVHTNGGQYSKSYEPIRKFCAKNL